MGTPIDFMQMGRGAGNVFRAAIRHISEANGDKIWLFLRSPRIMEETLNLDHSSLDWLLTHPSGPVSSPDSQRGDTELDDPAILTIYNKALSYLASIQQSIDNGDPAYKVVRRIGGFAFWAPEEFSNFLVERRPRALVVLAHFMAFWIEYEHFWVIGNAGERQIRGIHKTLPLEWSSKLDGLFSKFKSSTPGSKPP